MMPSAGHPPYVAPLCPAGHLPHRGGDQPAAGLSPIANVAKRAESVKLPISPLVGEMSGRTEGGVKERYFLQRDSTPSHTDSFAWHNSLKARKIP
jgi:hypothetical protein